MGAQACGQGREPDTEWKADTTIVDETAVNVAGRNVWLWIAIELGHGTVLALMLTGARNVFVAHSLFTSLRRREVRHMITDGTSRYGLCSRLDEA